MNLNFKNSFARLLTKEECNAGKRVLVIIIIMAIMETFSVLSVVPFFTAVSSPDAVNTNDNLNQIYLYVNDFGVKSIFDFQLFLGVFSFFVIVGSALFRTYAVYEMHGFIELIRHSLSLKLFQQHLAMPYSYISNRHSGDISKLILSEVDNVIGSYVRPIFTMMASGFVLLSLVIMLLWVEPIVSLIAVSILGFMYFSVYLGLKSRIESAGEERLKQNGFRFKAVNEALRIIKYIKINNLESFYIGKFESSSSRYCRSFANYLTMYQAPRYIIEALSIGTMLVIILLLLINSETRSLNSIVPTLSLLALAAYKIMPNLQSIFAGFSGIRFSGAALDALYKESSDMAEMSEMVKNSVTGLKCGSFRKITFSKVSYIYPFSDKYTFEDISFELLAYQHIGVIGPTGSGKSTLLDLLTGLLSPSSGQIYIDDRELTDALLLGWQKCIGYVPQDIVLADTTIASNIAFGVRVEEIDYARIFECLKITSLEQFVHSLPSGVDTEVGEDGARLSGGQKQRLGIARALYNDPDVIIFDEATSSLDLFTEKQVISAIRGLKKSKTIVTIAHRPEAVRDCDMIFVLDGGRLVDSGSFSKLSHKGFL